MCDHKFLVSVALGVDWVRVSFKFALIERLLWYVSILLMNMYKKTFGVGGMKGRNGGDTCLFLAVPQFTVFPSRLEMPVIAAAIYWGGGRRLAMPWHFEAEQAWRAICLAIGNFRGRSRMRETEYLALMEREDKSLYVINLSVIVLKSWIFNCCNEGN